MNEEYFNVIIDEKLYSTKRHLKFKTDRIFKGIDLKNKIVLDIGGGDGLFSFYAAVYGAKKVICLEPELDGSFGEMNKNFERVKSRLKLNNIELIKSTFQDYELTDEKYDIILMHNSINHLDEDSCEKLEYSISANKSYLKMAKKLNEMMNLESHLIICDCSNKNIYPLLGIKNPFASNIEWSKHQSPKKWTQIFSKEGFILKSLNWNSPKQLGKLGNLIFGNKLASFFIASHFRLELIKH